ncbi:hypothetical protein D3C81_1476250 [compost metagenome]
MNLPLGELIGWAISLGGLLLTLLLALIRLLLWQFEKRLAERFTAQEDNFRKVWERQDKDSDALRELETTFLNWKADLPLHYVRREDWVRNQAVIESKLDGLALKLENVQLKGNRHD